MRMNVQIVQYYDIYIFLSFSRVTRQAGYDRLCSPTLIAQNRFCCFSAKISSFHHCLCTATHREMCDMIMIYYYHPSFLSRTSDLDILFVVYFRCCFIVLYSYANGPKVSRELYT